MEEIDWELEFVDPIKPSSSHYVLFKWPISLDETGIPLPKSGTLHWNSNYVRLPCHPENKIQIEDESGEKILISRWEAIKEAFSIKINSSHEFEAAILSYNPKYKDKWKFKALHKMFESELDEDETVHFFDNLLPKIIKLALELPELVKWSIPLVKQQQNFSISLSQQQIASLLACAFLCMFPRRNNYRSGEYSTYPQINFWRLFQGTGNAVIQKILCFCHYFRTVTNSPRIGVVTFTRRSVVPDNFPKWDSLDMELGTVDFRVKSSGTIEDSDGMLQADFANKYLGGGVLGHGCVQEEIRFVICPELIVSKLFMESMKNNESVWIIGCERFSNYNGYASTFQWSGAFEDKTPTDSSWRKKTCVTAIDALSFHQSSHQFRTELMTRELNKAYVGFYHDLSSTPPPIASGNWGCGAFGGEPLLKSLLQLVVCASINRPLVYYTFGNDELKENLKKMFKFLHRNSITVGMLWSYLNIFSRQKLKSQELYSFIYQCFYDGIEKFEIPNEDEKTKVPPQKTTMLDFYKPLKVDLRKTRQDEIDNYSEELAKQMEIEEETELELTSCEVTEIAGPSREIKVDTSSNEKPTKGTTLMDALNFDYYEEAPVKKFCMDVT